MPRLRLVVILTALSIAIVTSTAHATPAETALLQRINAFRAANGLYALQPSRSLNRSSRAFARYQMRSDRFGHASRIWASHRFRMRGEAVAMRRGWRARTAAILRQWRTSPPHRALLLSRSFTYLGIGRSKGWYGRNRTSIWVAQTGR